MSKVRVAKPTKPTKPGEAPAAPVAAPGVPVAAVDGEAVQSPRLKRKAVSEPPRATEDEVRKDFRKFLFLVFKHLGLPEPTPLQYSMARFLQIGPKRKSLEAFRGAAKSLITAAYVLWRLYCDPQTKNLVVSGSAKRAVAFTNFCLSLIREMPLLRHLEPDYDQRQSATAFDVRAARPDQMPSVVSMGITGQLQGWRADLIVPDDVETTNNAMTPAMREKLSEAIKEFDAILKPGGEITFLGTPQTEQSIYNSLRNRGYSRRVWPARYPTAEQRDNYGADLDPAIRRAVEESPALAGKSTEPTRFSDEDLMARELSWGRSGFALQYMLDTRLSDADRYPIKLRDLIVMGLDRKMGPDVVVRSTADPGALKDLPVLGFDGDRYFGPAAPPSSFSPWTTVVMGLDPSGRGADETAASIVAELNGRLFLLWAGGWRDGYSPETLGAIAGLCVEWNVSILRFEKNFGDAMFGSLLQPYLVASWKGHRERLKSSGSAPAGVRSGTSMEEVSAYREQKELRVLSVLEPLIQQHRLVVDQEVIRRDYNEVMARRDDDRQTYSLIYQMAHLSRERGCLAHDDRVESLAIAAAHWKDTIGVDPRLEAMKRDHDRIAEDFEKFFEDYPSKPRSDGGNVLRGHGATRGKWGGRR